MNNKFMLYTTLLTGATTAALIWGLGLHFPVADAIKPSVTCLILYAAMRYWWYEPSFRLCLKAVLVLVAFSTVFCMLTYCLAVGGKPLVDHKLVAIDGALGFSAPAVVEWFDARPWLAQASKLIYFTVIPQTILVILFLGLRNDQRRLDLFLARFMFTGLLTAAIFYFIPAEGTCAGYSLSIPDHYQATVDHLHAMRDGSRTLVTWRDAEGLIGIPSYHAIWAVLLASAFYRTKLFIPMAVLNAAVVVSTIPTGMHYLIDVIAGLVVVHLVIKATRHTQATLRREVLVVRHADLIANRNDR